MEYIRNQEKDTLELMPDPSFSESRIQLQKAEGKRFENWVQKCLSIHTFCSVLSLHCAIFQSFLTDIHAHTVTR